MFKATVYFTYIYWHDVPETQEFETKKAAEEFIAETKKWVNSNGNCSFKNSKEAVIEEL